MSAQPAAIDRLRSSRERLRQAMREATAPPRSGGSTAAWLDSLKAAPGAKVLTDALSRWWAQHPLHMTGTVAAESAKAMVQPLAQRHPLVAVLGAFVLGGLFAWSRPWRWILTPALFAGLLPHLFSNALAHMPPGSWTAILTSLLQQARGPTSSAHEQLRSAEPRPQQPTAPPHQSAS